MQPFSESSTLPRGFRYHGADGQRPTTPEAHSDEMQQPQAPKQAKMKLKRRNNPANMSGPTEQFLASVAAADVPMPSIEIDRDEVMIDVCAATTHQIGYLAPQPRRSPPKTPVPQIDTGVGLGSLRMRDWYHENNLPGDISRPASSLSNSTDCSDDSYFDGRQPRPSEDGSCTSPDSDFTGPFSANTSFSKITAKQVNTDVALKASTTFKRSSLPGGLDDIRRQKRRSDAPWTKDMDNHLWQIYMLYLQDPTVTPFRFGTSMIPPEGVVNRVSREAKRGWKGPKLPKNKTRSQSSNIDMGMGSMGLDGSPERNSNSGSITPTGDNAPKAYPKWPHSSAATRSRLRELCKADCSANRRHRFGQSPEPTPFTQERKETQARGMTVDSMSASLDVAMASGVPSSSTPSIQTDGQLSKLSSKEPVQKAARSSWKTRPSELSLHVDSRARRLGSPFAARTYGPSTSKVFNSMRPSPPRTQSETVKETQLRSPVSFDKPRSLNGTMKRRAQHALDDELSPTGGFVRASILDEVLFRNPEQAQGQTAPQRRVRSRGFTVGDEDMVPRPLFSPATGQNASNRNTWGAESSTKGFVASRNSMGSSSASDARRRLGSPFEDSTPFGGLGSNTFPRRLPSPPPNAVDPSIDEIMAFQSPPYGTIRRHRGPFATMTQIESGVAAAAANGQSLEQRLRGLEGKLREFNGRRL